MHQIKLDLLQVDTVKDFLFELGIKPQMHQVEIIVFSPNNVTVRPTKVMNVWRRFYELIADLPGATSSTSAEQRGCQLTCRKHKHVEEPFSHGPLWKLAASKTVLATV